MVNRSQRNQSKSVMKHYEVIFNYGNKTIILMHLLYPTDQSKLSKFLHFKGLLQLSVLD